MPKMTANNGWGKRHYVWKFYKGLFDKFGKPRKDKTTKEEKLNE